MNTSFAGTYHQFLILELAECFLREKTGHTLSPSRMIRTWFETTFINTWIHNQVVNSIWQIKSIFILNNNYQISFLKQGIKMQQFLVIYKPSVCFFRL